MSMFIVVPKMVSPQCKKLPDSISTTFGTSLKKAALGTVITSRISISIIKNVLARASMTFVVPRLNHIVFTEKSVVS